MSAAAEWDALFDKPVVAPVVLPRLVIRVLSVPVTQGSMIPVTRGGKTFVVPDNATALRPWRNAITEAARSAARTAGWVRRDSEVEVHAVFFVDRPASAGRRVWPFKKSAGDLDKHVRALLDGLTDGGVLFDDSRVCRLVAEKRYTQPGQPVGVRAVVINGIRETGEASA